MSEGKERIIEALASAVLNMEEDEAASLASEYIAGGHDAYDAIERGLSAGMAEAGRLFEEEEYFIPELLMCADAMNAALDILKPHLVKKESASQATVVLGVVEGDTHDIGKNLVKIMLETAGYRVIDLGRDIAPKDFVRAAEENGASAIAISTLMTTTMGGMEEVVRLLEEQALHDDFPVIVGGGPISPGFARKIGADAYASNAAEAVRVVDNLVNRGTAERIAV
ncbi:MAG: corrinoid protein [Schwartzia sp.]|nr:corrinoid protein [Schwartzia sp. (in: firmicutes)]